jgi:hypothetical protein
MIKRDMYSQRTTGSVQVLRAPNRWQEMHFILSRAPATAEYGWSRRSSMICKWRADPAPGSAAAAPAAK